MYNHCIIISIARHFYHFLSICCFPTHGATLYCCIVSFPLQGLVSWLARYPVRTSSRCWTTILPVSTNISGWSRAKILTPALWPRTGATRRRSPWHHMRYMTLLKYRAGNFRVGSIFTNRRSAIVKVCLIFTNGQLTTNIKNFYHFYSSADNL